MELLVCVKQVPDTSEIKLDPETNNLIRTGLPSIVNPDDMHALEAALAVKDENEGSRVTVLAMGPPQAEDALRECLSLGADDAAEPVKVHGVVIRAGRGHRRAAQLGIPDHAAAQGGGQSPQGDVGPATLHKDLAAVCTAVDRHGISGRVCGDGLAAGGGGSHLSAAVPPDAPAAEGIQQSPEGNIGHAALQVVDALTQNGAVHLDGDHPAGRRLHGEAGQGHQGVDIVAGIEQ